MNKIVFFDLETSGLSSWKHEIIQIAAIAVDESNLEEIGRFGPFRVEFDVKAASPDALKINHYEEIDWKNALSQKELVVTFGRFLKIHSTAKMTSRAGNPYLVAQMAGHNIARFDLPFLQDTFGRSGTFLPARFIGLDTLQLAAWHFHNVHPGHVPENLKLGTLAEHFKIEFEGEAHDAMADVLANIQITKAILEEQ